MAAHAIASQRSAAERPSRSERPRQRTAALSESGCNNSPNRRATSCMLLRLFPTDARSEQRCRDGAAVTTEVRSPTQREQQRPSRRRQRPRRKAIRAAAAHATFCGTVARHVALPHHDAECRRSKALALMTALCFDWIRVAAHAIAPQLQAHQSARPAANGHGNAQLRSACPAATILRTDMRPTACCCASSPT